MKVLYLDIETSPNVAYVWGLYNQNIALNQLIEPTRMLCAAYAWDNDNATEFVSEWGYGGRKAMLRELHAVLSEADAVVHYNGASFDVKHINREFLEAGLKPPAPYAQVDLYRTVKRLFRFPSNKLAHLSDVLNLGDEGKLHTDMSLWVRVLDRDPDARLEMEAYNREDVVLLQDLYAELRPWIPAHPNVGLYEKGDRPVCVSCGDVKIQQRGYAYTAAGKFVRYQCQECGRWMREAARESTTPMREVR